VTFKASSWKLFIELEVDCPPPWRELVAAKARNIVTIEAERNVLVGARTDIPFISSFVPSAGQPRY